MLWKTMEAEREPITTACRGDLERQAIRRDADELDAIPPKEHEKQGTPVAGSHAELEGLPLCSHAIIDEVFHEP